VRQVSYEIATKELQSQLVVAIRATTTPDQLGPLLGELLPEVWRYAEARGAHPAGPPFARYHTYEPDRVDLEAGFPVLEPLPGEGRVVAGHLPQGTAAATWHIGPYDTLHSAYEALEAWIGEQGRRPAGAPWEVYWSDPGEEPDSSKWRTEVVWPIE
jgi:effector-binding domain-containing protein